MSALLDALHRLEHGRPQRRPSAESQKPPTVQTTVADDVDDFVDEIVPQRIELRRSELLQVEWPPRVSVELPVVEVPEPVLQEPTPLRPEQPKPESPQPLGWGEVALPNPVLPREMHDAAAEIVRLVPRPALAAAVAVGVTGELLPTLRSFGEAISVQTKTDVVLLGPGSLIDSEQLATQWSALRSHVGYGLVHTTADRALERMNTLKQTAGVIVVIELGQSTTAAVTQLREQLAAHNVPFLGLVVVRDE